MGNKVEIKKMLKGGQYSIVDVRTPEEFLMGRLENSINIPMHEVPSRLDEFSTLEKPLILCCASGNRSGQVASFLVAKGIPDVYNGGGWTEVRDILNSE